VQRVGDPSRGVHSIQVEINRGLYLDEARVEKGPGFAPLRENLLRLTGVLARAVPAD